MEKNESFRAEQLVLAEQLRSVNEHIEITSNDLHRADIALEMALLSHYPQDIIYDIFDDITAKDSSDIIMGEELPPHIISARNAHRDLSDQLNAYFNEREKLASKLGAEVQPAVTENIICQDAAEQPDGKSSKALKRMKM